MNPLQPRVLAVSPGDDRSPPRRVVLELDVPPALAHFAGHFPGFPILPGVVQLDWAVRFAREHLAVRGEFAGMESVKFLSIVRPAARLRLELRHEPERGRLAFAYSAGARKCSSGRILFGRDAATGAA